MGFCSKLTRRKREETVVQTDSPLARVLTCFDLVALGVGSTLGVGIYVIAGGVAKEIAGPAVVLSFVLAAIVTAFAGMCFAEFGARVPKAGSAYVYSYYCIGELTAFVIGWSLIMEYSIGAASVAKGISSYVDALTNHSLANAFTQIAPLEASFLADFVDFFAMSLCLVLSALLAFGVKDSSMVNRLFTTCNVLVVLYFIGSGIFKADFHNWNIDVSEIPADVSNGGDGGFFPFGLDGVVHGAAICFYGFVGFDCIATTGEEVKNPQRAIPLSIMVSLFVILLAYFGVSAVITLMVPYYLQDIDAPIPHVYDLVGWPASKWVVGLGALFGLFASLFGALFPLPRVIYAMANDGLLYRWLGRVHSRYQTPMVGTITSGIITSLMAAIFNLQQLVGLNAIGTLLTYTLVSVCVIVLRYRDSATDHQPELSEGTSLLSASTSSHCSGQYVPVPSFRDVCQQSLSFRRRPVLPTPTTSQLVTYEVFIFCILSVCLSVTVIHVKDDLGTDFTAVAAVIALVLAMAAIVISIALQPASHQQLSYKMPMVPLLPCLSIVCNVYLMAVLDAHTWIRFICFVGAGFFIYFTYGIRNSSENDRDDRIPAPQKFYPTLPVH